jgi:putative ABC transport system permease protein
MDAFKSGRLIILDSWYYGENYKDINGDLTIKSPWKNTSGEFNIDIVKDSNNIFPPGLPAPLGIPTIYISNSALKKLDSDAVNYSLLINADRKYEEHIETELKNITRSRGLWFESKSDETEAFNKAQMVMNILGGGISIILILIGILNFINVIITGVNARLKELAIMESIGMTKKQIKKMLTFEGLYYASITTLFISTIGMAIIYGIAYLTKQIADYAEFLFPTITLIILIAFVFAVCLITPGVVFKQSSKSSVIERIREIEN